MGTPAIGSKANLNTWGNGLGKTVPSIGSKANMTSWGNALGKSGKAGTPAIGTKANLTSYSNQLTKKTNGRPAIGTTASLTSYSNQLTYNTNGRPAIGTTASMTTYYNSLTGRNRPVIPVTGDIDRYYSTYSNRATGGSYYNGKWHDIPQYASGGSPSHGTLFFAGERGAELVGHVGGRTEVLNQSQLASTMYSSVVSANASQNRLLQEQNNLLRELISAQGNSRAYITAGDIVDALSQRNRRDGRTVVPIGV
jgi:hypothetical protein